MCLIALFNVLFILSKQLDFTAYNNISNGSKLYFCSCMLVVKNNDNNKLN